VTVYEVGWDNDGSEPVEDYIISYGDGSVNRPLGTGFYLYVKETDQ
jgi:hypothetical protein